MKLKLSVIGVAVTLLGACAGGNNLTVQAPTVNENQPKYLTILHTNDTHGRFWSNSQGEYGFAAQKALVDAIRREVKAKGGEVLLLHAGDMNTGVPESDLLKAEPDIVGLNAIGYEAMTLGNHEFDFPESQLQAQRKLAKFPFLSANIFYKNSPKNLVQPYTILNKGGIKVAVLGLTTADTATIGNPEYTKNFVFQSPIEVAKQQLPQIQAQHRPDLTIALTHLGYYHNAQHGSNAPGDVTLARSLPQGAVDIIVGGHSHTAVCLNEKGELQLPYTPNTACRPLRENGTWVVQADSLGKYLGRADFTIEKGKAKLVNYQLIPINLKQKVKTADGKTEYQLYGPGPSIPADVGLQNTLQKFQNTGDELLGQKVGKTIGVFDGNYEVIRQQQTNFGQLVNHVFAKLTQADVAIMNSGGIRDSLPDGDITYRDVLKVLPFGNTVAFVDLTGQELKDYIQVVALKSKGSGGYPQWYNIGLKINRANKQISDITVKGQAIDLKKTYRLVIPQYVAIGGDDYPALTKHRSYVDTGFVDAQVLKSFLEQNPNLKAQDFVPKNPVIEQ